MCVWEDPPRFLELLEANDRDIGGEGVERVVGCKLASDVGVFLVVKDTLRVGFDGDIETGIDEFLGGGMGECGTVFGRFHLASEVEGLRS